MYYVYSRANDQFDGVTENLNKAKAYLSRDEAKRAAKFFRGAIVVNEAEARRLWVKMREHAIRQAMLDIEERFGL